MTIKQPNLIVSHVADKMNIDATEIAKRLSFLEFSAKDVEYLKQAHRILEPFQSKFIESFYTHLLSFEELHQIRDGQNLDNLKEQQARYFTTLTAGQYDWNYVLSRLNVGLVHNKIGLDIKWYIGAYRKYLSDLITFLGEAQDIDSQKIIPMLNAIIKIITFDMGLAIETYVHAGQQTIINLEQHLDNLIQGIDGFIWEFDVGSHLYRYVSRKAESLLGFSQKRWTEDPKFQQQIIFPADREKFLSAFNKAIITGQSFQIEYRIIAADTHLVWVSEQITAEKDQNGKVILLRGLMLDIGERKRQEDQLTHLATHDALTNLPNRSSFLTYLKSTLTQAKRTDKKISIMFLDLDGFKDVNDSLGHNAGDQLLQTIGERLANNNLRDADFVARFGGDEFCIILENIQEDFRPAQVAHRCLKILEVPTQIGNSTIYPRASIGIALFPRDGETAETLLQCADNAMYAAKKGGKHRHAFYNPEMTASSELRLRLESDLRKAVENDEFELHYQPQISLETGKICGVEALIRWRHPERGLVPPDQFISVAEKIGLIVPIGEWVLNTACLQFINWQDSSMSIEKIAVNISGSHFRNGTLPRTISKVIKKTGIQARELEIEITEGVVQTGKESNLCFERLKEIGINISIDDFGTGYSCLNSLTQLPIDTLKIDKSFIQKALIDSNNAAIVETIISMSRALGFSVVAEGVETPEQLKYLQKIGCDIVQGFYFSKPVVAEQIPELAITVCKHNS